jgi:hypothetical protein
VQDLIAKSALVVAILLLGGCGAHQRSGNFAARDVIAAFGKERIQLFEVMPAAKIEHPVVSLAPVDQQGRCGEDALGVIVYDSPAALRRGLFQLFVLLRRENELTGALKPEYRVGHQIALIKRNVMVGIDLRRKCGYPTRAKAALARLGRD